MHNMWSWYGASHGAAFAILGVVVLVALILLLVRGSGSIRGEEAVEILGRRLAAGEITQEQ